MSATNRTANYNLPQFVSTDIPTWLTDVNGAMSTIDTAIKGVADSVVVARGETSAVDARVDATNANVATVAQSVATAEQNIATLQQGLGVANSNITANTQKIGTATLDTVAQTLSGAINELKAEQGATSAYDLLLNTSTEGTFTLNHDLADYKFLLIEGFATSVTYNMGFLPVHAVLNDNAMSGFKHMFGMNTGGSDRHIAIKFNSGTSVVVSDRNALNLRLYGFN